MDFFQMMGPTMSPLSNTEDYDYPIEPGSASASGSYHHHLSLSDDIDESDDFIEANPKNLAPSFGATGIPYLAMSSTQSDLFLDGSFPAGGNSIQNSSFLNVLNDTFSNGSNSNPPLNDPNQLPDDLKIMSESARNCVIVYSVLFVIASTGNLTVFASCYRQYRKHKSRITLLILHLSVADLIVSFCLIPIEVFWRITIQWYGGTVLCKVCQFVRAFGLYLSSMVLICISFDRFFAILFPLKFAGGKQRVKVMLAMAWIASGVFSAPQAIFFSLESHPKFPSFRQCVTSFLSKPEDVKLYSIFSVSAMYFAPLLVIIFTFSSILLKIFRKSREQTQCVPNDLSNVQETSSLGGGGGGNGTPTIEKAYNKRGSSSIGDEGGISRCSIRDRRLGERAKKLNLLEVPGGSICSSVSGSPCLTPNLSVSRVRIEGDRPPPSEGGTNESIKCNGKTQLILRMSNNATSNITRAKSRTLRLTIVIVVVFVLCWTPYVVMTLWYMFDWETAQKVDPRVQDALFLMAVANSCVNPLIYGSFTKNCCGITKRLNFNRNGRGRASTRNVNSTTGSS